jgi:hypothetical protein
MEVGAQEIDELLRLLQQVFGGIDPRVVGVLAAAGALVRGAVLLLRRFYPQIDGNLAQTVTAVVSLVAVAVRAAAVGVFGEGLTLNEGWSILAGAASVWAAATLINEVRTDRNPQRLALRRAAEGE